MEYSLISLAVQSRIATLTLNDPEHLNRVSERMRVEFIHALRALEDEDIADCLIVTGAGGRAFSAGANINEVTTRTMRSELMLKAQVKRDLPTLLENLRLPSVACIRGWCLGAGTEIALGCTLRIASETARIGLPEINLGIIPGGGGTQRLARMVGMGRAMEMVTFGEPISAQEAHRIGLVNAVHPESELCKAAEAICAKWQLKGAFVLAAARDAVLRSLDLDLQNGIEYERKLSALCLASGELDEGVAAFREKRTPRFRSK